MKHLLNSLSIISFCTCICLANADSTTVSKPIAKVGDAVIYSTDVERAVKIFSFRLKHINLPEYEINQMKPQMKISAFKQLIQQKILLAEAKKKELTIPAVEIEKLIDSDRRGFANEEAFRLYLDSQNMSIEQLREFWKDELTTQGLIYEQVSKRIRVLPKEIHEYYIANTQNFVTTEMVHFFQIYIKKKSSDNKEELAKAKAALKELEDGTDFRIIAKLRSEGPKKDEGGDWGYIERDFFGKGLEIIEETAFSLKPKKYSGIVESQGAYHIIYINDKKAAGLPSEKDLYEKIKDDISRERYTKAFDDYIEYLKSKTYVEILDEEYKELFSQINKTNLINDTKLP